MEQQRIYAAIDLKSFYASVECVERGLDPLDTCLVVADKSRTDKTICLAVSPALKAFGIPGRPRLFEVIRQVEDLNALRRALRPGRHFTGRSHLYSQLEADPGLELDYITAVPHMKRYMEKSAQVVGIYLQYMAPEDIHVYSVDEVLLDLTPYLKSYGWSARTMVQKMIRSVLRETGITATAGIGTNLYLCKVAMDIVAKHMAPDADGVRIASLTEQSYREELWNHCPLTDFWRIGPGITRKLQRYGMYTMGAVARMSLQDPDLLYHLFGVNAELLIDHAWGWEPCTLQDIRAYRPQSSSLGSGQVLQQPCSAEKTRLIVWEMADLLALDLVKKQRVTDQLVLTLGYDRCSLEDPDRRRSYRGKVVTDHYGRLLPAHAHGSCRLPEGYTDSGEIIRKEVLALFDRICDPHLLVRKVTLTAEHVQLARSQALPFREASLFEETAGLTCRGRETGLQQTILRIQELYGKNALLRGSNLLQGAMTRERNRQVGGHRA